MEARTGQPTPAKNMKNTDTPRAATEAQINANRLNAKKSSGPKTAEGKAASSRNGLTHGLTANKHILLDEDPEQFLLLLKDLYDRFHPVGLGEEKLVQRIAADQWRLDRTIPMEAAIYRNRLREVAAEDAKKQRIYVLNQKLAESSCRPVTPIPVQYDEGDLLARAFDADCDGPSSFAKLARYEASLERSIDRCLRQLKAYQAARLKDYEPNPNTEDVGQASTPAAGLQTRQQPNSPQADLHIELPNQGPIDPGSLNSSEASKTEPFDNPSPAYLE